MCKVQQFTVYNFHLNVLGWTNSVFGRHKIQSALLALEWLTKRKEKGNWLSQNKEKLASVIERSLLGWLFSIRFLLFYFIIIFLSFAFVFSTGLFPKRIVCFLCVGAENWVSNTSAKKKKRKQYVGSWPIVNNSCTNVGMRSTRTESNSKWIRNRGAEEWGKYRKSANIR